MVHFMCKKGLIELEARAMTDRRYRAFTLGTGILLQLIWLWFLFSYARGAFRWYSEYTVRTVLEVGLAPPEADLLYRIWIHGKGAFLIATVLWGLFVCVLGTKELLAQRPLGRSLAILISIDISVGNLVCMWIAGSYHRYLFWTVVWGIVSLLMIRIFSRRQVKAQFRVDSARVASRTRLLVDLYALVLVLKVLLVPSFIAFLSIKMPEELRIVRLAPERAEYVVSDSTYLKAQCKQQEIFGCRILLPDHMKVFSAFHGKYPLGWSLWLRGIDGEGNHVVFEVTDEGEAVYIQRSLDSEHRRFKSPSELERALYHPTWSPDWMMLKSAVLCVPPGLVKLEEVTSTGWKGFVRFGSWGDGVHNMIVSSMYDSTGEYSVKVVLIFNKKSVTIGQVKSILASLEFETDRDDAESFRRGLIQLEENQYTNAAIRFLNALHLDPENPHYAYCFAQSLLEDTSKAYRKRYLKLSKKFLEYSIELDSNHVESVELLPMVDEELARIEAEESQNSSSAPLEKQSGERERSELEE
jgi:hypothetical protein